MANCNESICRSCFHSYVCEQFNENKNIKNNKCHFFNDHFAPTSDVVEVVRCKDCRFKTLTEDGEYNPHDIVCEIHMSDGFDETDYCSYGERKCDNG